METTPAPSLSKGHRFPLRSFVMASGRTSASRFRYRDVEEIMAERGVKLTYETVRKWCLDEVFLAIVFCKIKAKRG
jgi:hypothetical protein